MKSHIHLIVLLAISVTILIPATVTSLVYAQPCTATLGDPEAPTQNGTPNVSFVIPVSASCTTSYSQLYATGNAYDTTSNISLGTTNAVLSSVNGGTQFNGQLSFSTPPTTQSDSVQISVSLYDNPGGNLITQTSETVAAGEAIQQSLQQITTTTVTVDQSPYADPSPTGYQSPYQPNPPQYYNQPQYEYSYQQGSQDDQSHYFSQGFPYRTNNHYLLEWIAVFAIFATVIITTAGLVLAARRPQSPRPAWYPTHPPPAPR